MSLKAKKLNPTSFLHFKDAEGQLMYADLPDGTPDTARPIGVNLYGPGSREYIKAREEFDSDTFMRMQAGTLKSNQPEHAQKVKFLSACTHSWVNVDVPDESEGAAPGAMLSGDALTAAIWPDPGFVYLVDQAELYIVKNRNFTQKPAKA